MKKRLIKNLLLVLTMVVLCFAVMTTASAETEGYYTYEVVDGNAVITDVDESISGDIVIPDTLGGYPVTEIGRGAFYACTNLENIIIPNSVIDIGDSAFCECKSLEKITFSDNIITIGDFTFADCYSLTDIYIGKDVRKIGLGAFLWCYSLKNVCVDKNNQYYFADDNGVLYTKDKSILILYPASSPITTYVVDLSTKEIGFAAFIACCNLKELILPDGLKKIGDEAFTLSSGLKSIKLPETLEYIGHRAFYNVLDVQNVVITSNFIEIGEECFGIELVIQEENFEFIKEFYRTQNPSDEMIDKFSSCIIFPDESARSATIYTHAGSTAETYAIDNGIDYVLTHFYEGEWINDDENGIRYRKCIHCDETETEVIEPALPEEPEVPDTPETPEEKPVSNSKEKFFIDLFDIIYSFIELLINLFTK